MKITSTDLLSDCLDAFWIGNLLNAECQSKSQFFNFSRRSVRFSSFAQLFTYSVPLPYIRCFSYNVSWWRREVKFLKLHCN